MKGTYKSYGMSEQCPGECKKNHVICSMYISSWVEFHSQFGIQATAFFFGKVLNHMVRQSNFLFCFLSYFVLNGQAFLTKITTTMCARVCLKYGPVKIEIRFLSLKAVLILHIFWDLEDFSWTDSKLSSFSCNGKDRFPSTGIHQIHSNSYYNQFSLNISRAAFSLFLPQSSSAHFDPLLFNHTTNSVKICKINKIMPYVLLW